MRKRACNQETEARTHTKMNLVGGPAAVTTILLLLIFINCSRVKGEKSNPFISLTDTPPDQQPSSSSFSPLSSSPVFPVFTRVLNAFPPSGAHGSHVTVVLDEDRIEGVGYGRVSEKETMMRAVEDFVIDFKSPTTGAVVVYGVGDYGYIEGEVGMGDEVVVIVRRSDRDPLKPAHDIKRFPARDLGSDTSRIYLYNAVWSNNTYLPGMNFYKVNRRTGKLITLASGLLMGESVEITASPGKTIIIKASHADLTLSHDPDTAHGTEVEVITIPGRRHYVVVLGDQASGDTRAVVMGPTATTLSGKGSSGTSHSCSALLFSVLLAVLMVLKQQ